LSIDYKGDKCNCGSFGCIEAYAGNSYLINRVVKEYESNKSSLIFSLVNNNFDSLTPKVISDAVIQGDQFANNIIQQLGNHIGYALASVANLMDITSIIIGGGVAGFGEKLFDSIELSMRERVLKSLQPRIKILPAKLSNDAGIKGASSLVFYKN
ncbi:MAG: ROK family protein, partial [Ignavibacteriaceae bacterium]|nr:ROK family protein [Ignavibacteriaceae bacterium]